MSQIVILIVIFMISASYITWNWSVFNWFYSTQFGTICYLYYHQHNGWKNLKQLSSIYFLFFLFIQWLCCLHTKISENYFLHKASSFISWKIQSQHSKMLIWSSLVFLWAFLNYLSSPFDLTFDRISHFIKACSEYQH